MSVMESGSPQVHTDDYPVICARRGTRIFPHSLALGAEVQSAESTSCNTFPGCEVGEHIHPPQLHDPRVGTELLPPTSTMELR
ncbi:hypothetical protein C0Q70_15797 [Pomacea canaliculata]|uniref:Uncharacterized protein n=1 Tax=Pomacea canaliculata TaxID=400727 RepID=A0A2T7NVV7_POMCA|nr:hypothetical protein C0Q70_15797 [Pomacea canaliculata]